MTTTRFFLLGLIVFSCLYACTSKAVPELPVEDYIGRVMIVPDIQNYSYSEDRLKYLDAISDYYFTNKDIVDVTLQVGDLTYHNVDSQYVNVWNHFFRRFSQDDQLVFCLGNHDYGNRGSSDLRESNIPEYMMPFFDLKMESSRWENYVRYVTIGDVRYGVMVLEFCTRDSTLEWANQVLKTDCQTPFIILLHVFLDQNGEMFDTLNPIVFNEGSSHKDYQMGDDYKNDSREIFDKIIYNNTNVKMVVCGHCLTPSYIKVHSENNVEGSPVRMIEVNYQHYKDGGEGQIGVLDIYNDLYRIRSYSTYLNKYSGIDIVF